MRAEVKFDWIKECKGSEEVDSVSTDQNFSNFWPKNNFILSNMEDPPERWFMLVTVINIQDAEY